MSPCGLAITGWGHSQEDPLWWEGSLFEDLYIYFFFEAGLVNVVHKKHLMVFCMISRDPAVVVFSSLYINI